MKDMLISLFIDDELDLDQKIEFVEVVHADPVFKTETVGLLDQEKLIRSTVVHNVPPVEIPEPHRSIWRILRPFGMALAGLAAAAIVVFFFWPTREVSAFQHRFVIYQPEARQVDIAGSFSRWHSIPMRKVGNSGYWEITLELPQGEYRFSYILDGGDRVPDPTILTREHDDFGGENSILELNASV